MFNFPRVSGMEAVFEILSQRALQKRVERGKRALALLAGAVTSLITFTPDYTHLSPAREIVTHSHGRRERIASHRQRERLALLSRFGMNKDQNGLIAVLLPKGQGLNNGHSRARK